MGDFLTIRDNDRETVSYCHSKNSVTFLTKGISVVPYDMIDNRLTQREKSQIERFVKEQEQENV